MKYGSSGECVVFSRRARLLSQSRPVLLARRRTTNAPKPGRRERWRRRLSIGPTCFLPDRMLVCLCVCAGAIQSILAWASPSHPWASLPNEITFRRERWENSLLPDEPQLFENTRSDTKGKPSQSGPRPINVVTVRPIPPPSRLPW
jgi:hypothetical protein